MHFNGIAIAILYLNGSDSNRIEIKVIIYIAREIRQLGEPWLNSAILYLRRDKVHVTRLNCRFTRLSDIFLSLLH